MKTIFLGLILILINSYLFAQNKFVIGFALKPQVTSIIGNNEFINSEKDYRIAKNSFSYGLSVGYKITDNTSINSGIYYNPQGVSEEKITINDYGDRYFRTDIDYLRIPVKSSFNLLRTNKVMVNIATGLGLNYLLNTDDNLTDIINFLNCIIKEPDQRYNQFVFDASVSIGFDYSISGKLMLTADLESVIGLNRFHQPYSLGSNADIDINSRICSLGLEIGLKYKLK